MTANLTRPQLSALRFFAAPQPRAAQPGIGGMPRWDVTQRLLDRGLIERVPDPTSFDHRITEAGRLLLADAVKVGDHDPLAVRNDAISDGMCQEKGPGSAKVCTRPEGHPGKHVACGVLDTALAVWS